jgi:hypothetical protein
LNYFFYSFYFIYFSRLQYKREIRFVGKWNMHIFHPARFFSCRNFQKVFAIFFFGKLSLKILEWSWGLRGN